MSAEVAPATAKADEKTAKPVAAECKEAEIFTEAFVQQLPTKVQPYAKVVIPILVSIGHFLNSLSPLWNYAWVYYEKVKVVLAPYYPRLLGEMLAGIGFMFFGGFFVLTLAAAEAFRIAGFASFIKSWDEMYVNYKRFMVANQKDNEVDEDGDGIADVHQQEKHMLVTRKIKVFMLNTNPVEISEALGNLYTGVLGVVAALRIQFARTIALGATIGELINAPTKKYIDPYLFKMVPKEYHGWVTVGQTYATRTIGVSVAWFLQRIISSVHAAMRGSKLFCDGFAKFTAKFGYTQLSEGYFDEVFAVGMSIWGLYFQLTSLFMLPWFLSFLLFPLVFLELVLTVVLSYAV